jgi:mannose-1-phosphate guanylyltransferase
LEPVGRNTAPAIALACFAMAPDEVILVTPSDHLIKDETAYRKALNAAETLARDDNLVTFGITPDYPETGFGYIESEKLKTENEKVEGLDVVSFHEKPDIETAKRYLEAGNFYWNSGMFCFKAGRFLEELQTHAPEIYTAAKHAFEQAKKENTVIRIREEDMQAIPEESIDYAVMEKSEHVKVVPADIGWSDLGSFDSLHEELPKDENGNTLNTHHIAIDSKNNFIYGNDRKIATVDIEDTIVVDTGDAILIARKGSSQKVKEVVKKLKEADSELHHIHLTAHRPWGTYTVLEDTPGYKIKRIEVKPGKRLSLQKHFHRSEHWIVVSGTATVTVGEKKYLVRPNESTYIKMGEVHRLENEGKIPVVLIEAQVGEYTGEDDIVRIEDDFKREES